MLGVLRRILGYQMTIAEWIGTAVLVGIPYLVVGIIWAATQFDRLGGMGGAAWVVSFLGMIASWPVLLISTGCMA